MPSYLISVVLNQSSHLDRFVFALNPCWEEAHALKIYSLEPYLHQDMGSKSLFQFRFATNTRTDMRAAAVRLSTIFRERLELPYHGPRPAHTPRFKPYWLDDYWMRDFTFRAGRNHYFGFDPFKTDHTKRAFDSLPLVASSIYWQPTRPRVSAELLWRPPDATPATEQDDRVLVDLATSLTSLLREKVIV